MVIEVSHGLVLWSVFSIQHPIELLQLLERYVALSPAVAAEKAIAKVPHRVPGDTARIQTRLVRPKVNYHSLCLPPSLTSLLINVHGFKSQMLLKANNKNNQCPACLHPLPGISSEASPLK